MTTNNNQLSGKVEAEIRPYIQSIAESAAKLRSLHGPKGKSDTVTKWKVTSDYGTYVLTVSCRYRNRKV